MKILIGVDPHKTSVAVAAVDEAAGELLERASFPQDRAGLRSLERWASRFPERRSGRWRTPVVSVSTWREGWLQPVNLWWTCRPNFQRGYGCSRPATLARTTGSMPSPLRWPPRATSGWQRWIQKPHLKCCACFPRDARTWWPSVHEPSRQPARAPAGPTPRRGGRETLGRPGSAHPAWHTGPWGRLGPPPSALGLRGTARRPDAGQEDR